jgi:hypothetical protein
MQVQMMTHKRSAEFDLIPAGILVSVVVFCLLTGTVLSYGNQAMAQLYTYCLLVAFYLAARQSYLRWGRIANPTSGFFCFACTHALFSYHTADWLAWTVNLSTSASAFYDKAFGVVALGICSAALAYLMIPLAEKSTEKQERFFSYLERIPKESLLRRARLLTMLAIAGVAVAYALHGSIPLFSSDIDAARYDYNGEGDGLAFSLLRRSTGVLAVTIPTLFLLHRRTRGKSDLVFILIGIFAVLSTFHRAVFAVAFARIFMVDFVIGGRRARRLLLYVAAGFGLLMLSQLLLAKSNLDGWGPLTLLSVTFSEVRDFSWCMSCWNGGWYYGKTYLAGLLPVPTTLSSFKDTYAFTNVTKQITGMWQFDNFAGLRISAFGESYFNFGYLGPLLIGSFIGSSIAIIEGFSLKALRKRLADDLLLPFGIAWIFIAFLFYLSGSLVIMDAIVCVIVLYLVFGFHSEASEAALAVGKEGLPVTDATAYAKG